MPQLCWGGSKFWRDRHLLRREGRAETVDRRGVSAAHPDSGQMLIRLTGALPYLVRLLCPAEAHGDNCAGYYRSCSFQPSADTPVRDSVSAIQAAYRLSRCNFPTKNGNNTTRHTTWICCLAMESSRWAGIPIKLWFFRLPPTNYHIKCFLFLGTSSGDGTRGLCMLNVYCITKLHSQPKVSQI